MKLVDKYISLETIFKKGKGFQFYSKDGKLLFEVIETETKNQQVATSIIGSSNQDVDYIKYIDEHGDMYVACSVNSNVIGSSIYDIHYECNDDWYALNFLAQLESDQLDKDAEKIEADTITDKEMLYYYMLYLKQAVETNNFEKSVIVEALQSVIDELR